MEKITITELRTQLKDRNYSDEEIEEFITFVQPFYDFNEYMLEKTQKSQETIDKEFEFYIQYHSSSFMSKLDSLDDETSILKEYISNVSLLSKQYAKENEYKDYEKVGESMKIFFEFLLTKTFNSK